jgi:hypothetical protein
MDRQDASGVTKIIVADPVDVDDAGAREVNAAEVSHADTIVGEEGFGTQATPPPMPKENPAPKPGPPNQATNAGA